jgi:hypothetical protein
MVFTATARKLTVWIVMAQPAVPLAAVPVLVRRRRG